MSLRYPFLLLALLSAQWAQALDCTDTATLFAAAYQRDNHVIEAYQSAQCPLDISNERGLGLYDVAALTGNTSLQSLLEQGHAAQKGKYSPALIRLIQTGTGLSGFGRMIIIRHPNRVLSAYGYLDSVNVSEGQKLSRGQQIGTMGIGSQNMPTLHFETRKQGKAVNPYGYIGTTPRY